MDDTGGKTLTFKKTDETHTHTKVKAVTFFQLDMYVSVTFAVVLGKHHISANGAISSKRTMLHRLENGKRLGAPNEIGDFSAFLCY